MSSIGDTHFLFGLSSEATTDGIYISQDNSIVDDILKKFDFCSIRNCYYSIELINHWSRIEDGVDVVVHGLQVYVGSINIFNCIKARHLVVVGLTMEDPVLTENQQQVVVKFLVERIDILAMARIRRLMWQILLLRQEYVADANCLAGKPVTISEASIRSDLLFDDADGIDSMHNQAIFDAIQLMGHLDAKKKFVMYPRFISVFLDKQLKNVHVPLDHFPINALTSKVFSFMVKKGKHFSGNVTPLFESMLVQPTEDEGEASERQSEPQPTPSHPHSNADQYETQPNLSPRPSPTIPDSIPEGSGGNHRDQAKEIKHLKAQIKKLKKKAKPVITHHKARMKSVSTKQRLAGKKPLMTKWMQKESVSKQGLATLPKLNLSTAEPKDGTSDESTAPTTVFRDDETIAEFLVSMSQNKAKQKGVEIKDAEDSDRRKAAYRPCYINNESRELIKLKESFNQLAKDEELLERSRPPTRTQLRNQMMTYVKHVGGKKHADLKNKNFEEIQVLYKKVKRSDKDFIAIGSAEDERQIKEMNEESKDPKREGCQ
ncbi:hypothetical protein Tco_0299642 [Tanacetum coccineum]